MSGVLRTLDGWPVDNVAAAVLTGGDTFTHGDTRRMFDLASVSKLVTAYATLIAVEEGAFALDDTVAEINAEYGPEYGAPVEGPADATVRDLLSHASGVGMRSREREKPAHTRRIYSSAGYEILADLVSATGIPFPDYVREAVAQPLGIPDDALGLDGSAGHGFRAPVDTLSTLAGEFLAPTLVSEELWAEALTPQFPQLDGIVPGYGRQTPCPWGLGPEIHGDKSPHWLDTSMPADVAGHFGQAGTFLWFHRPTGRAAVVLTDRAFGAWARERWDGFNAALWDELS